MRIETVEFIEALKTFRNGCSFRFKKDTKGYYITHGCSCFINLLTGSDRYIRECMDNKKFYLKKSKTVDSPRSVISKIKKAYKVCSVCGE